MNRLPFEALPLPARHTDPDTSHAAAVAARSSEAQATLTERILESIRRQRGASGHMVAADLGITYQQASRRISDLRDVGAIRDNGKRVLACTGRKVIVWEVA